MGLSKAKGCSDAVLLILCMIPIYFLVWGFTGMMPWTDNPYNSYTLQALAWLNGRLDLGRDYSHLEIAYYGGKYFVSFPPFPSYVMLPFAIFCGADTPDHFIALAVSLLGAVYALRLLHEFDVKGMPAVFWALFLTVGTNLLFISVNGWVWFIAQNMSYTLCIMCLFYAKRGNGGIALALWAAAVGCRPFQALYLPVVLYLLYENSRGTNFFAFLKGHWTWCIAPAALAASYMWLNYMRFGSVLEFGHNYLPEFLEAEKGQFDWSYVRENMQALFKIPPISGGKWMVPKFNGMAFWLVSPIFVSYILYVALSMFKKEKVNFALAVGIPVLIGVHFLLLTAHKTMGGWHFGNRYTNDALPFLFYGLLMLLPREDKFRFLNYPLFLFGVAFNLIGTVAVYNNWI